MMKETLVCAAIFFDAFYIEGIMISSRPRDTFRKICLQVKSSVVQHHEVTPSLKSLKAFVLLMAGGDNL